LPLTDLAVGRGPYMEKTNRSPAEHIASLPTERLGKVKVGKSSISFTSLDDVDLEQLSDLITEAKRLMT